jgi:hypothetical protein
MIRSHALALFLVTPFVGSCAVDVTDMVVAVYSALPFSVDGQLRGVCIDVTSRGLPMQRVFVAASPGVPPRRLFEFKIVPRDDDLSQPVTVTTVARSRAGCSLGVELTRRTRILRFIPGERVRETMTLGDGDPTVVSPDGGVDVSIRQEAGTCACPTGQTCCANTCSNTQYDPRNCGGCGIVCQPTTFCVNGTCSCPTGQFICDGVRCTDPRSDPDWCGSASCGGRCPEVVNGRRLCEAGRCVYTCNTNFEPIGGMCVRCGMANDPVCDSTVPCVPGTFDCGGFCRSISNDRNHCGACNNRCPTGQNCVNSGCR